MEAGVRRSYNAIEDSCGAGHADCKAQSRECLENAACNALLGLWQGRHDVHLEIHEKGDRPNILDATCIRDVELQISSHDGTAQPGEYHRPIAIACFVQGIEQESRYIA